MLSHLKNTLKKSTLKSVRKKCSEVVLYHYGTHNLMFVNIFLTPPLRQQWSAFAIPPPPPPAADIICEQPRKTILFHYVLGWKNIGVSMFQRCIETYRSGEKIIVNFSIFWYKPMFGTNQCLPPLRIFDIFDVFRSSKHTF